MGGKSMPDGRDPDCFWQKHGRCLLFAALAVLVGIAVAAVVYNSLSKRNAIDHITAVYDGSTKAGTVLDEDNKGFTVTILNGSMSVEDRDAALHEFREHSNIFISSIGYIREIYIITIA